ncbi:conjugal transfer protein TraD [Stakelama sp. CBK3Z-3]|uniref:Conjugal transfer protein TraD n=1 Tax=Stakelama flava TaxID=2860338 RepID=A0ABS6XPZ5_9SPHN|nr:conjugal transfer protein TraD [Stakelama flava]MBW4332247.1 conjugal transfer protein TraD [Stakelama flava]MBW4332248.1 conjugal transfer protein TraD [Stakelama flava]MBW4332297.1 conjugal transfer protein TraD [Stakelama flava]
MRKPRDYDSQLKALDDKAKQLKDARQRQFGELVAATGADALSIEQLAGALIAAAASDLVTREEWRKSGAAFFQRGAKARGGARAKPGGTAANTGGGTSAPAASRAS